MFSLSADIADTKGEPNNGGRLDLIDIVCSLGVVGADDMIKVHCHQTANETVLHSSRHNSG